MNMNIIIDCSNPSIPEIMGTPSASEVAATSYDKCVQRAIAEWEAARFYVAMAWLNVFWPSEAWIARDEHGKVTSVGFRQLPRTAVEIGNPARVRFVEYLTNKYTLDE